ncbi:hypothetical protein [Kitasatospora sp. NPDC056181]
MNTWLPLVRAAGDIAAFATALIGALTTLGRRRAAKRPPARHDA